MKGIMHKNSSAKYNAVKYDLNRLRAIYTDTGGTVSNIDAQQAFLHFSAEINGLLDWLKEEKLVDDAIRKNFLSSSKFLFLVAKIATLDKHAATDSAFWQTRYPDIRFNNHAVLIPPQKGLDRWITQGKYVVTVDGIEQDALALAEGALSELDVFLQNHQIDLAQ